MALETVFLVVLVTALFIGNALLSLIPGNGSIRKSNLDQTMIISDEPVAQNEVSKQTEISTESQSVLFSNFNALNNKLNILISHIEDQNLKLRKLDHFRANTSIEMGALKEIIVELQNKYLTASSKKVKNSKKKLSTNQMHKIIYRSK